MKKFAAFLVDRKNIILAVMLLLCVISAFLLPMVDVNKDMTVYLPDDSPMKEGLDVMAEEFPDTEMPGSIRVMFENMPEDARAAAAETLAALPHVTAVAHENTADYVKDPYTLFVVSCDVEYHTPEEEALEEDIAAAFPDADMILQHTAATIDQIPVWVYILVLVILLLILFLMCSSYVEPFLFLFTIGAAVLINLGSNLIFGQVSETTYALSAILQLALSMDYSIILMNRYRQAKTQTADSSDAMKAALQSAFPSIFGSGMTTVLGLLMLVFMRFRIGLDLGRVMAKGVALSMICVITVLPALILLFDRLIEKSKKKEPHIPTGGMASYAWRARRVLAVLFPVFFAGMLFLQGMTTITFAQPKNNTIENVFPSANPVIVLYDNDDEEAVRNLLPELEGKEAVDQAIACGNLFEKPLSADEMGAAMTSMSPEQALDPALVNLLYYEYHHGDALPELTPAQFIDFLTHSPLASSQMDKEQMAALSSYAWLTAPEEWTAPRSAQELSALFGVDPAQILLLGTTTKAADPTFQPDPMTLPVFVGFLQNDIAQNPAFAAQADPAVFAQLAALAPLLDAQTIQAPLPAPALAAAFGLEPAVVDQIFMASFGTTENQFMSMVDFGGILAGQILPNPMFAGMFPEEAAAQIGMMNMVMGAVVQDTPFPAEAMAAMLGMKSEDARLLYTYHAVLADPSSVKMSLRELLSMFAADPALAAALPADASSYVTAATMPGILQLMNTVLEEKPLDAASMAALFTPFTDALDADTAGLVYLLYGAENLAVDTDTLTVREMLSYLAGDLLEDERFAPYFDDAIRQTVLDAHTMVEDGAAQLRGENHALLMLNTSLPGESAETTDFIVGLRTLLDQNLDKEYYLIGNSPMNVEMEEGFSRDLWLITLLSAAAIFLVVAVTFRSAAIPAILVLLVQCGVFVTVAFTGLVGHDVYYLSLLIVQCILMGATIDYAIVFTNYYIEHRRTCDVADSLRQSFSGSIHTILTSGLIIILITGIIGFCPADPAITEICQALAVGTLSAVLLILLVLPGLLAALDRFVIKSGKAKTAEK